MNTNGTHPLFSPRLSQELHRIERLERERSAVHRRITQICGERFASRCQGGGKKGNPHGFDYLEDGVKEAFAFAKLAARDMQGIAALVSETVPIPAATKLYFSNNKYRERAEISHYSK
jgi:hypothetical protein